VPNGREVCEKQLFNLVDRLENAEVDQQIEPYLPVIYKKLEWLSREDLIKHFVSEEFNRFLSYYKDAPDLNVNVKAEHVRENRGSKKNYSRFYINQGSKNGLDAGSLIALINKYSKGSRVEIGKIEIMKKFSFFEVDPKSEKVIQTAMSKANFRGAPVLVQPSKPDTKDKQKEAYKTGKKKKRKTGNKSGTYRK